MTRPAKPGDIAIVICCPETSGANVGKQCLVEEQCRCFDDHWTVEALEPHYRTDPLEALFLGPQCRPGEHMCYRKKHLIVKEDPDAGNVEVDGTPINIEVHHE
jgi:hypothetical protein